jgi:hypothetical protein
MISLIKFLMFPAFDPAFELLPPQIFHLSHRSIAVQKVGKPAPLRGHAPSGCVDVMAGFEYLPWPIAETPAPIAMQALVWEGSKKVELCCHLRFL